MKWVRRILIGLLTVVVVLVAALWLTTFHPRAVRAEAITCQDDAPILQPGQVLEVMSWNVQYMAGKGYVFCYDLLDESGPDERPSPASIAATSTRSPASSTMTRPTLSSSRKSTTALRGPTVRTSWPACWTCSPATTPVPRAPSTGKRWRPAPPHHRRGRHEAVDHLPLPDRRGTRHHLPIMPADPLTEQLRLRRAILEVRLPTEGNADLVLLNTHLDAFAQGTDTMQQQVAPRQRSRARPSAAETRGCSVAISTSCHRAPIRNLREVQRVYYEPDSELAVLTDIYPCVPRSRRRTA